MLIDYISITCTILPVMDLSFLTPPELQKKLGEQLRALRLNRNLSQRQVAEKGGLSLRTLINLEAGAGSSLDSFVRVLKALEATDAIAMLVPEPRVSPLALLKRRNAPRRAGRSRN